MSLRTLWSAPALAVVGALTVTWTLATSCRTAAPVAVPGPTTSTTVISTPALPAGSADALPPATRPSEPPSEPAGSTPSPLLRVGLTVDGSRGSIGADHGVVVTSLGGKEGEARRTTVARATFLPVAGKEPSSGGRFRVQVASLAEEGAALAVADRVKRTVGLEPSVRRSAETRTHQVRVGEFPSRDEALRVVGRLAQAGLPGAFVVSDIAPVESATRIRLLETGEFFETASVLPVEATDTLTLDATAYRGYFEVRSGQGATVTVVNVVALEDYLRGVVPNELSPLVYPEIEALKAQAVAARTYAIRNRGQFASRGYDICATPSCQVYRGRSSESPLSDRAVAETRGTIVSYRGAPIHALYTSTCGGHTEDGEAIFEEHGSYLKGVACLPERAGSEQILTQAEPPALVERGNLSRDVALLQAMGVFGSTDWKEADAAGVPRDGEVRGWIERLIATSRRNACAFPVGASLARRADFMRTVVGALCWDERGQRLLGPTDVEVLLQAPDAAGFVGEAERRAAALLLHEGALSPLADGSLKPTAAVTRAQAAEILARVVEVLAPPSWLEGEVAGVADGRLALHMGDEERSVLLSSRIRLFRDLDGARSAARRGPPDDWGHCSPRSERGQERPLSSRRSFSRKRCRRRSHVALLPVGGAAHPRAGGDGSGAVRVGGPGDRS